MVERGSLPPPLMTSQPGSFARQTIVERKPQILCEVGQAHAYPPQIQEALATLAREIAGRPIRPLLEEAPDVALWNGAWAAFQGRTWLDVPWYFAEAFFYRRLMEAVRFYQPGPWRDVDPFGPQKAAGLERALPAFVSAASGSFPDLQTAFVAMLHDALWGNLADLSNRPILATAAGGFAARSMQHLVIDDTSRIWAYMAGGPLDRVDVIADNSGLELLLDLRLADFLLQAGLAGQVRFHLKRMPFFVSDTMLRDLHHTLDRLRALPPHGLALAARLEQAIARGQMAWRDDPFWSTCLSYRQIPPAVRQELSASNLVLLKGDVNYRRLLDDRHWPHTAHLADIATDFPAPFVALRTLKGELIVGLQPGQAEALSAADPTWMINGQRGLIQFIDPVGQDR